MSGLVTYESDGTIATITLDDGKVNVLSPSMLGEINGALDRAEEERAVVVLTSGGRTFSAGFDLRVLQSGTGEGLEMVKAGFELGERVLSFPTPVVAATPGNAVAMGLFLLLSCDYRIGARGPAKLTANEVAIGMTLPRAAIEILRLRLAPTHFTRVTILAEPFGPDEAVGAGMLDAVVEPAELMDTARAVATRLETLDFDAYLASKLLAREDTLRRIRESLDAFSA